jgi:hypothetical protein
MRHIRNAAAALLALGGLLAPARTEAPGPEATLAFHDSMWKLLLLENGEIRTDRKGFKFDQYSTYFYQGKTYRKLSAQEVARLDAMPRVGVRRGGLYLDGGRVRTNSLWVLKVYAAYHWNGGVILAARTSKGRFSLFGSSEYELGFIDPKAGRCRFSVLSWKVESSLSPQIPDFLAPVTIDSSNGGLELDVGLPEGLSIPDSFDLAVSLANRSDGPVQVPDSLVEGLGMVRVRKLRGPSGEEVIDDVWMKRSEPPTAPRSSPLGPRRRREVAVPFDVKDMLYWTGRYRVVFYWDGFLDPGDGERVSRFFCERWVEVTK